MFWAEKWKISEFFVWKFSVFEVKFSTYLNRRVFATDMRKLRKLSCYFLICTRFLKKKNNNTMITIFTQNTQNARTPYVYNICSNIWNNPFYFIQLLICLKTAVWVAKRVDPDQTPRSQVCLITFKAPYSSKKDIFLSKKGLTRTVRGSDYSTATVPSEEKDTSVLKNFDV